MLTASHDGTVKMWDVRTDRCVATVGRCSSAVLCMEYDDNVGILAAAGRDVYVKLWILKFSFVVQILNSFIHNYLALCRADTSD